MTHLAAATSADVAYPESPGFFGEAWQAQARCTAANAVYFYAPSHFERKPEKDAREGRARALCRACDVQQVCLAYSLAVAEGHGIWGGLNELQRKRLLRARAAQRS